MTATTKFRTMARAALALGAAGILGTASTASAQDLRAELAADMPELMELYRDLHAHPELSFEEVRTAAKLSAIARDLGFEVTEQVGQTGVVAVMENGPGPVVMLRADMDGLPVGRTDRPRIRFHPNGYACIGRYDRCDARLRA